MHFGVVTAGLLVIRYLGKRLLNMTINVEENVFGKLIDVETGLTKACRKK